MFAVGGEEIQVAEWTGNVPTIASVLIRYFYYSAPGVKQFLQADLATFSTSDHSFAATQVGNEWRHTLTAVPDAAWDKLLEWEFTPDIVSDIGTIAYAVYVGPEPRFDFTGFALMGTSQ